MAMTDAQKKAIAEKIQAGTYTLKTAQDAIADAAKGADVREALYALPDLLANEGKAGCVDTEARSRISNLLSAGLSGDSILEKTGTAYVKTETKELSEVTGLDSNKKYFFAASVYNDAAADAYIFLSTDGTANGTIAAGRNEVCGLVTSTSAIYLLGFGTEGTYNVQIRYIVLGNSDVTDASVGFDSLKDALDSKLSIAENLSHGVGDALGYYPIWWESGTISSSGAYSDDTTYLRTPFLYPVTYGTPLKIIIRATGYQVYIHGYTAAKNHAGVTSAKTETTEYSTGEDTAYISLVLHRTDSTAMSVSEGGNVAIQIENDTSVIADVDSELTSLKDDLAAVTEATRNLNTADMGGYYNNRSEGNKLVVSADTTDRYFGMDSYIAASPGTGYVISVGGISSESTIGLTIVQVDSNGIILLSSGFANANTRAVTTLDTTAGLYVFYKSASVITLSDAWCQIELGASASAATAHIVPVSAVDAVERETVQAVRGEMSDMQTDLQADISALNWFDGDFGFSIGYGIDSTTGNIMTASNAAVTRFFSCHTGDTIYCNTATSDSAGIALTKYVYFYKGGEYIERSAIGYQQTITVTDAYDSFAIVFGRSASAGIAMTQEDIDTYFAFELMLKELSTDDIIADDVHQVTAVNTLVGIAETYFDVAYAPDDFLIYVSEHGPFSTLTDSSGIKAIVCSQFTQACFGGIKYANSRYTVTEGEADRKNIQEWWGFTSDGTGEYPNEKEAKTWSPYALDYMDADGQRAYFNAHGIFHPFNADHNGMLPGDIVYYHNGETTTKATHCSIALRCGESQYTYMEANTGFTRADGNAVGIGIKIRNYESTIMGYVHASDIPILATESTGKLVSVYNGTSTGTQKSSFVTIGSIVTTTTLGRGLYTFNADVDNCNVYLFVIYADGSHESFVGIPRAGISSAVCYFQQDVKSIELRVQGSDTTAGQTYNTGYLRLYKGYMDIC